MYCLYVGWSISPTKARKLHNTIPSLLSEHLFQDDLVWCVDERGERMILEDGDLYNWLEAERASLEK